WFLIATNRIPDSLGAKPTTVLVLATGPVARLSDRPPHNDREHSIEIGPRLGWKCIPLPSPCDCMRKPADPYRDFESRFQSTPPRLQIYASRSRWNHGSLGARWLNSSRNGTSPPRRRRDAR